MKNIVSDVREFIKKSLSHQEEYATDFGGKKIFVHPEVLSPEYSHSSQFLIENWDVRSGMVVLDMGTGTGVLALSAAFLGAKVVAVDINPFAVKIAKKNFYLHKVSDLVEVVESDLFEKIIPQKFDRIIFNAPYWNKKSDANHPLTLALYDEGYKTTSKFLEQSKNYLVDGGKILFSFSNQGDVLYIEKLIEKNGLKIEKKIVKDEGHTRILYYLSY